MPVRVVLAGIFWLQGLVVLIFLFGVTPLSEPKNEIKIDLFKGHNSLMSHSLNCKRGKFTTCGKFLVPKVVPNIVLLPIVMSLR